MADLKPGSVADFANSMAEYIDNAMLAEWRAVKNEDLPNDDQSREQRQIMFAAVAQGVLRYLRDNPAGLPTDIQQDTPSGHAHTLVISLAGGGS